MKTNVLNIMLGTSLLITAFLFIMPSAAIAADDNDYNYDASGIAKAQGEEYAITEVKVKAATVPQLLSIKKEIEKAGARILAVIPPDTIIINSDNITDSDIKKLPPVKTMASKSILSHNDNVTLPADFCLENDNMVNDKTPISEEERDMKNKEYLEHWNSLKAELISKDMADCQSGIIDENSRPYSTPGFGTAFGADYFSTSSYMLGSIAVGVYFDPSFTTAEIDAFFDKICADLLWLATVEPLASISFTLVKEVNANGTPKAIPGANLIYHEINDLRNVYGTSWGYLVIVSRTEGSYASVGVCTIRSDHVALRYPLIHETFHVFHAPDQYQRSDYFNSWDSAIYRWGYLAVINANSRVNDGNGYFGGAGEGLPDIMNTNGSYVIGPYARGHLGWQDSDGDGIFDVMDTNPDTTIWSTNVNPDHSITVDGYALDKPLLAYPGSLDDTSSTMNYISKVEYDVNYTGWRPAVIDGISQMLGYEHYRFTTPALPNGSYSIRVRSTNSVGNPDLTPIKSAPIYISGSTLSNIEWPAEAPATDTQNATVVRLTVTPADVHGTDTFTATLDARATTSSTPIMARWDFEGDGVWDTGYSDTNFLITHTYNCSGPYTKDLKPTVEIIEMLGGRRYATRSIRVVPYNHPPNISNLECSQTGEPAVITIRAIVDDPDTGASWDGALEYRWDLNNDGEWDQPFDHWSDLRDTISVRCDPAATNNIKCEVRDKFNATSAMAKTLPTDSAWCSRIDVPETLEAGQMAQATISFINNGTTTWTKADLIRLGVVNTGSSSIWGVSRIDLADGELVLPGRAKRFTFYFVAPKITDKYLFQWQMTRDGVHWFGTPTPPVSVTVIPVQHNAQFLWQDVPQTVRAGATYTATIAIKNTGAVNWTKNMLHRLGSRNPRDNMTWGLGRVELNDGEIVRPGDTKMFRFNFTAPRTAGVYNFQWRMLKECALWFGDETPNLQITVTP